MVGGLAVVLHRGDGPGIGVVVGQDEAVGTQPGHVDLPIGQGHGDPGEVAGDLQLVVDPELRGHVGEEGFEAGLGVVGGGQVGPDPEGELLAGGAFATAGGGPLTPSPTGAEQGDGQYGQDGSAQGHRGVPLVGRQTAQL